MQVAKMSPDLHIHTANINCLGYVAILTYPTTGGATSDFGSSCFLVDLDFLRICESLMELWIRMRG